MAPTPCPLPLRAPQALWEGLSRLLDSATAERVQMLRGAAMATYFEAHLTSAQREFMTTALRMPALPGVLPESVAELRDELPRPYADRD